MQQERTEEPTPRRRERARAEGQAPRSYLLSVALSLIAALALWRLFEIFTQQWLGSLAWSAQTAAQLSSSLAATTTLPALVQLAWSTQLRPWIATSWLVIFIASVVSAMLSGSLSAAPASLVPRWRRLSLRTGLHRIASRDSATNALFGSACVLLVSLAFAPLVRAALTGLLANAGFPNQVLGLLSVVKALWWRLCIVVAAFACLDVALQQQRHRARLLMTPHEVREDRAQTEAKPETKQHRRAVSAKRSRSVRLAAIKRASAVVTNPTQIAVALRYAPPAIDVPVVVARGAERLAARIREVAAAQDVPVIESADLARRLYTHVDVDDPIPEEYYAAVAAVFAWIVKTRGRLRRGDEEETG